MKNLFEKSMYIHFLIACVFVFSSGSAFALPSALQPSTLLDFSSGVGMASGSVSNGHEVFHFDGIAGDMASISLEVTGVHQSFFDDDDTRLFLFGGLGQLLTSAYGINVMPSIDYLLAETGTYYVAVTTYGNRPLNSDSRSLSTGQIIDSWTDRGRNNVDFDLMVDVESAPVPEPATMLLFGIGLVGFGGAGLRKKKV